jgi:hypothetical protein
MIHLQLDGAHTIIAGTILLAVIIAIWFSGWCLHRWVTRRRIRK